ncbi:rhamnogalacturonan acetylesterase [Bacillus sp. AK128]
MSKISIFIAGDSTASSYSSEVFPRAGWGQVLHHFFTDEIRVINEAASGRSSKSFIEEGRLRTITNQLREGDYLFIQFGHNDAKNDERYTEAMTSFKYYVSQYIDTAWNKRAIPILITPVQRRSFNEEGIMEDTHGLYPFAIHQLGLENNIPVIDLTSKSKAFIESIGVNKSKEVFLWLEPGKHEHYPHGVEDNTHFSTQGAKEIAKLIVEGIVELKIPLEKFLR